MSNRVEPEIPNISLDDDLVKSTSNARTKTASKPATTSVAPAKSSGAMVFFTFLIYIALAGAGYFFYLENQKLHATLSDAEQRIQQLEDQLSATGEEMGESTVALKAKLQAITEKTEKLWSEMDKLWASAWRRNQSEIKELKSQGKKLVTADNNLSKSIDTLAKSFGDISEKQTASEFAVEALSEQLQVANNLKADLDKLSAVLNKLQQRFQGRSDQQLEVASNVSSLDSQIKLLIERIESLENKKPATIPPASQPSAQ